MKRVKSLGVTLPDRGMRMHRPPTVVETDPDKSNGHHLMVRVAEAVAPGICDKSQDRKTRAQVAREWKVLGQMLEDARNHCRRQWRLIYSQVQSEADDERARQMEKRDNKALQARVQREKELASEGLLASGRPIRAVPPAGV